jgi:uncharacterized membrane protein YccF (DUF307 family)
MRYTENTKSRGNVIYNVEWQFWLVVVIQLVTIVGIPPAIQNLLAFMREAEHKKQRRQKQ